MTTRRSCQPRQAGPTEFPAPSGTPLALSLTGGNHNDIIELLPLVDAIPPVRGKRGRPRRRPRRLLGDGAYHSRRHCRELRARGISAAISRPKQEHGSTLGTQRWVVERTIAWLHQYRRLRVRYERGSIIITSNRGFEQWAEILGDAMVAAAPSDRLIHHATMITPQRQKLPPVRTRVRR